MPTAPNTLAQVAEQAKTLGYKILRIQLGQIDLAYGSLKVEITQNHIVTRFYLQDTIYNKNNYPGLHNHRTPPTAEKIVKLLNKIKQNYRHIRDLHGKVLQLGTQIDDLIQRMRLYGMIDKSIGHGGIAENLHDHSPMTMQEVKPRKTINEQATAKLLTEDYVRSYYRKYLKRLKKTAPRQYLEELQRLQSYERRKNSDTIAPLNPPVVFNTVMPTHHVYATDAPSLKPTDIINQAIAKTRSLRQFNTVLVSLAKLGGDRYLATLRLTPKIKTKQLILDGRAVQTIAKELSHLTHYKFRHRQFVIGKRAAITFGVFIPKLDKRN